MEATAVQQLQFLSWIDSKKIAAKPRGLMHFSRRLTEEQKFQGSFSFDLKLSKRSNHHRTVSLKVSCSYKNSTVLESGNYCVPVDESLKLHKKSQEIEPHLNGHCIYLVGMMGSGKTTVGKILSKALGYSFSDCDTLVEQEVGTSVAEIFKLHGEEFFREKESEVLRKMSLMHRFVVSTGGGAVTRTKNWNYMNRGISVWLDVPLEALVKRVTAVGTNSRPLLHHDSTDAYSKTLMRLSTLLEEREEAYAKAKVKVSCENIAAKLGTKDVFKLTPMAIAIEALEQIQSLIKGEAGYCAF